MRTYKLHIFTALCICLISLIYHFETEVNQLDREIMTKIEYIEKAENDISVMEAEWSYQNSPKRLLSLSKHIVEKKLLTSPKLIHLTDISNIESKKIYFSQVQNKEY